MNDLALWRMMRLPSLSHAEALPLLAELTKRPLADRMPFLARLISLTRDESQEVCAAALRALGGASGSTTFQALVRGLQDSQADVRLAALEAIHASSADDPSRMVHALFHGDAQLRKRALQRKLPAAGQWMTIYLLPDPVHSAQILADLPTVGLPADAVPALFDMLAAGSLPAAAARDVLLRMRPGDLFERLRHGRAREAAVQEMALKVAWTQLSQPEPGDLAANDDAFDDAIDLFLAESNAVEADQRQRFCLNFIAWLAQAKLGLRRRAGCSLLRRLLLDRGGHAELLRVLMVAWPQLAACDWLPATARREAAFVFYEFKDKAAQLPIDEVKELIDRAAITRPSGNLDVRLLGALGRLLADSPLQQMVEWYGVGRIKSAFEEDLVDSAPFLTLPCNSVQARRGLVDAICADKRPRLPKIIAALLHQLSADLFDVLEPLTPYEVTPLLIELGRISRSRPDLRFGDHRLTRLAQELARKIVLDHSAYHARRATRGAAIVEVVRFWATAERGPIDSLVRELFVYTARELPADTMAGHLLTLDPAALSFLLVDQTVFEMLPIGLEHRLREELARHESVPLQKWAQAVPTISSERRTTVRRVRQLTVAERTRYIDCPASTLTALLSADRDASLQGLAEALALRPGEQQRSVLAAESILACDDPLTAIDAALARFLPTDPSQLAELDVTLVARCGSQLEVGFGAHLWLYRWEQHLEEFHKRLVELDTKLEDLLLAAQSLRTPLLAEHCFRATATLLAQWQYRNKPKFREHATRELGLLLVDALPGPFGEFAARMLMGYVRVGGDDSLLNDLRAGIVRQLPDVEPAIRLILADWVNSTGLGNSTRRTGTRQPPDAQLLSKIRGSRILDQLAAWAGGDDLAVADEAILRLVELGESGVSELATLLLRADLPAAALTIAASLLLWPDGSAVTRVQKLVQRRQLPPDVQFEAALSLCDRGERATLDLAIEAVLVEAAYNWFKPSHWQRLEKYGLATLELSVRLVTSSQPHAYIASVNALAGIGKPGQREIDALRRFLEQGINRAGELRVTAARRLHREGDFTGFPVLLGQEMAPTAQFPQLLSGATAELVLETVEAFLAVGPRHARESTLLELLIHQGVDPAARETALRHLLMHGQNQAVRLQVLTKLRRTGARDAKLRRVAQTFAWGVLRARELTGRLFSVQLIGGDDLGYTRFEQPKVHINALPILRGEPHGEDIVRGLILHELGHHMYHADEPGRRGWKEAQDERIFSLLNLVSDEHLERRLRAQDASFGDPLKRLAAYAFQHSRKELPVSSLLEGLQGRAFEVLTHTKLAAARKTGHVAVDSGTVLRQLERTGHSFARFVRALRMGLGNRHHDPRVDAGLKLFGGGFRNSTMPELLDVTRGLQRIFGWQVMMLDVLSQDSLTEGDPTDLTIEGEGLSNEEVQREVRRILDPKRERHLNRGGGASSGAELWINVNPDEAFAPISTIEPVPFQADKHREYAVLVRRPAIKMRAYFEQLGMSHIQQRHRLQGRLFDRSRAVPMVIRGEPRVLIARQLVSKTDLFLGVVIDCSGSMQSGNNIEKARRFGELLAEAVQGLRGIDLRIFGFTDDVIYDAGDASRCSVHGLVAGGGNNDAAALWHAAQQAQKSRRRAKLLVMISDGLPTECSVAALKALVNRLTVKHRICCAQVAVRPIEEACFSNYIELNEADMDGSVQRFGRVIVDLVRKTLGR